MAWPALAAAHAHDATARVPLVIGGCLVGSVARCHLGVLQAWREDVEATAQGVTLRAVDPDSALARINAALHSQGLIGGWRDELIDIVAPDAHAPLARTERASARFWGTLAFGAHANGYVVGEDGRPSHLWVARRALTKSTDPGLLDNLVGGGVAAAQTPHSALLREAWEEAGLSRTQMQAVKPGSRLSLQRDRADGLQREHLHAYDLALAHDFAPKNQDGEVQDFERLPVADALVLAAGTAMTVDAALVTLDFALRHGLLPAPQAAALAPALFACTVGRAQMP